MDDQNNQQNQSNNQNDPNQQYASSGSIEAGPVMPAPEAPAQKVEYGNEILKRIESSSENPLEQAERKEFNRPDDPRQKRPIVVPPTQPQQPKAPAANAPKYFGYNIPQQLTTNPALVKSAAGKGDPKQSRTWIFVLLDRMLKMRAK